MLNKPAASACSIPGQQTFTIIEFFFGRDIPGRGPLTEAEWTDFAAQSLTDEFPDGFTVLDGAGQWFDQRSGKLIHEGSKVVIAAADPDSDLTARIGTVVNAYRQKFHQQSVGVITAPGCGAF
jgi:Protein of unknown function (DUF3574)